MSFVNAATEQVAAAASGLAGLGASISSANTMALGPTSSVLPPGADEVSANVAMLFDAHAEAYQTLSTQAAMFHEQFVQLMNSGAMHYALTETTNASPLQAVGQGVGNASSAGSLAAGVPSATAGLMGGAAPLAPAGLATAVAPSSLAPVAAAPAASVAPVSAAAPAGSAALAPAATPVGAVQPQPSAHSSAPTHHGTLVAAMQQEGPDTSPATALPAPVAPVAATAPAAASHCAPAKAAAAVKGQPVAPPVPSRWSPEVL